MRLVVDASVAVKWFVEEDSAEPFMAQAEAVLAAIEDRETQLFAPSHWMAGVVAVLSRLEPRVARDAIITLHDMRPEVVDGVSVLQRAAALAIDLRHHLFDTLYHAVALEADATLVTADARYFAKAEPLGAIRMLGSWTG